MRVFISYNHSDREFVSFLESSLKEKYIDYFLDEKDILYGDSVSKGINEAFKSVTHLIVVISPGSAKSHWVSFEIGMALGKGLKVIPILVHPAMDLPPFIKDFKYFKSKEEFDLHFYKLSLNTLNIEAIIDLVHCQDLGMKDERLKGQIGFRKFEDMDEIKAEDESWEPAFTLEIINKTGRTIELESPMIEFKKPQEGIANDTSINAIGFMPYTPKELVAGGKVKYAHFGNICRGSILAFINNNIKCITIKSKDGFKYTIDPTTMLDQKEYAKKYFKL
jgi:hypothetical protein